MARMAKDFSELKGILQNMVRESAEAIADRAEDVFKTEIRRKYDVQYPRERDEDGEPGWFLHSNKQKYLLSRVKGSDIKVETLDKDDKGFVIGIKPDNLKTSESPEALARAMRVYGSQMRANDPWVPLVHKIMRPGGLKDLLDMSGVKYTKRRG